MLSWALAAIGIKQLTPEEYINESLSVFNAKCSSCHGPLSGLDRASAQAWLSERTVDDVLASRIREAIASNTTLANLYGGESILREIVATMRKYVDLTAAEVERAAYLINYVSAMLAGVEPPKPPIEEFPPLNISVIETGKSTPVDIEELTADSSTNALPFLGAIVGFTTGLVAVFSPCVLPILVAQLSLLAQGKRAKTLSSCISCAVASMAGTIGIGGLFLLAAIAATTIQEVLLPVLAALILASGITSLLGVPFELRALVSSHRGGLLGFCTVYGVLAVQCNLPIVTGALLMIASSQTISQGLVTLLSFSLGISLPLAIIVFVASKMPEKLGRLERYSGILNRIGGGVLILAGMVLLLYTYGFI